MATSSGNSSASKRGRLRWLGLLVLLVALASWWSARRDIHDPPAGRDTTAVSPADSPAPSTDPRPHTAGPVHRPPGKDFPRPTLRDLADRHETKPDAEEWDLLLRLLQQELPESPAEEDRDLSDAVAARFAAHAGACQVDELASIYHNSPSMEIGQRALEVLGTLQSEDFQSRAREIIADATLPADDQIVTALARSLASNGSAADIALILDRIDTGKARSHSEYNGMDGLMSAVHQALAAEMEQVLCEALSNNIRTWPSRLAAAGALRNHATSASTQALSHAAQNDPDPRVATAAAESLAHLRTPEE